MATFFPHAKLAKLLGSQSIESQARDVRTLLGEIRIRIGPQDWERVRRATILVNGVNIHRFQGVDTPLGPDDKVWMVVPSGGG